MPLVGSRVGQRTRLSLVCFVGLLGTFAGCRAGPTEVDDGTLRVRVDRAGGMLRITNRGLDSVLVGVIGRATAVSALRIACGSARVGLQRSVSLAIPARETEAIVFYCALPLSSTDGVPPERSFIVGLTK